MSNVLSEDYVNRRVTLRQQSQAIYQTILSTNGVKFDYLLTEMATYSHHELRMLLQGYFLNFEHCEKSPWLLLFSSEEYLSKLVTVINLFGPNLPIFTTGMTSLFQSISPIIVSIQAGVSVLSAVLIKVPNAAATVNAQSAELLRAAIELTSSQEIIPTLNILYQNNVNLNAKSFIHNGETALIFATRINQQQSVRWLIEHGVDMNTQDDYGFTALHHATAIDVSCIDLLEAGADPNIQSHTGVTALFLVNNVYSSQLKYYNIIPKGLCINKKSSYSVDINILKLFSRFGCKIYLARSQDNPNLQCSPICLGLLSTQQKIIAEIDIFVPVLFNNYDNFVHIPFRGILITNSSQMYKNRRKLLCITVKHGYPVSSLRFRTADTDYKDFFEEIRSTIDHLLRYFQQPYPAFLIYIVVNQVEVLLLRNNKSIPPSPSCYDYIINSGLEIGYNSKYSDKTLSLYFKSICLILQLLSSYPSKLDVAIFSKVCRYVELTVIPYWYNQMLDMKGCNDPNNYLCICIGAWMSFFLYIWKQSLESNYEASFQMLEKFYKRISSLCNEFQPIICMMLYSTSYYYTSNNPTQSYYGYETYNTEPYLKTISRLHPNFIEDTILLLTSLGEDINNTTFYRKQTALLIAVESNARENFIHFLLKQGASPYAVDTLGYSIKEYCEIGLVSTNLIPLIDKIYVQPLPLPLQLLCVKCLSSHRVNIGNLLEHNALRRLLIVFT